MLIVVIWGCTLPYVGVGVELTLKASPHFLSLYSLWLHLIIIILLSLNLPTAVWYQSFLVGDTISFRQSMLVLMQSIQSPLIFGPFCRCCGSVGYKPLQVKSRIFNKLIWLSILVVQLNIISFSWHLSIELLNFENLRLSVAHRVCSEVTYLVWGLFHSHWFHQLIDFEPFVMSWLFLRGVIFIELRLEQLIFVSRFRNFQIV